MDINQHWLIGCPCQRVRNSIPGGSPVDCAQDRPDSIGFIDPNHPGIIGVAQVLLDATGLTIAPADQAEWEKYEALVREDLAQVEYERYRRQGFSMPYQQAVKVALGGDYLSYDPFADSYT